MPVTPGTPWRNNGRRRGFIDNVYFWSRAFIRAGGNTASLRAGQMIENLELARADVDDMLTFGWVPTPLDPTTNQELTFTVAAVTGGLTGFGEASITCSADLTTVISVGTKFRFDISGSTYYGVVTTVGSGSFIIVTPVGQAPLFALSALTNCYFSCAARPFGFPADRDASWTAKNATATTNGVASGNDTTVTMDQAWNIEPPTIALHLPGGSFEVSFASLCEGHRNAAGVCVVQAGLSTVGNTAPATDLMADAAAALPTPSGSDILRATLQRRADRTYASACPAAAVNLSLNLHDSGTTNDFHVRHDVMESRAAARFTLL